MTSPTRICLVALLSIMFSCAGSLRAHAIGESIQILALSPVGSVSPGTPITFYVAAPSFVDPVYAVSDAFSAAGATTGTIDKAGYFSWTPGVYDAGRHTLTITVNDTRNHAATTTATVIVASDTIIINSLLPGPTVAVKHPLTFAIVAPGFTTPSYTIYDSYAGSTATSGTVNSLGIFSWAPTVDEVGAHLLTIVASDLYGHRAQSTKTIAVINPTVSFQSLKPGTAAGVGSSVSFVASGNALSSPTYSVSDTFNGTSTVATNATISSAGIFSWKPASTDIGLHTLTVTAADVYGNAASSTLMIAITNAPATVETPTTVATPASPATITTQTTTSTPHAYTFTKYLGIGSTGTAVIELQKRLISLGLLTGQATGYFGQLTAASVKRYQKSRGLEQVGFVGPGTRAALNKE